MTERLRSRGKSVMGIVHDAGGVRANENAPAVGRGVSIFLYAAGAYSREPKSDSRNMNMFTKSRYSDSAPMMADLAISVPSCAT